MLGPRQRRGPAQQVALSEGHAEPFKTSYTGLVLAFGSVWVGDWDNNQVLRLPLSAFK